MFKSNDSRFTAVDVKMNKYFSVTMIVPFKKMFLELPLMKYNKQKNTFIS